MAKSESASVFDLEPSDEPVVSVAEVWQNRWGDPRAVLSGDTYEVFKKRDVADDLDWDDVHHGFKSRDDDVPHFVWEEAGVDKAWVVDWDADSQEMVEAAIEEAGGKVSEPVPEGLKALAVDVRPMDSYFEDGELVEEKHSHVEVVYESAKADWEEKSVSGYVVSADKSEGSVGFRRHGDDHLMHVKPGDNGDPALFTSGSRYPFMGHVKEVRVSSD